LNDKEVSEFEDGLVAYAYNNATELCAAIDGGAKLNEEQIGQLRQLITDYKENF
jgi:F0F1-type ATP synthase alpha subunit